VVLQGGDDQNIATVRWAANNRAGVRFEHPITPKHLDFMRYRDPSPLPPPDSHNVHAH
jgi:hypothetical protein